MSEEAKKPTAVFWITVALAAVLVGYPLSIGPAGCVVSRLKSQSLWDAAAVVYRPLALACSKSKTATWVFLWYAGYWEWPEPGYSPGVVLPPGFELDALITPDEF